jgi:Rod binding domain-containing protein
VTIRANNPTTAQAHRAALVKQARVWVSQTFFGTLLKQMHDSPFKSELFSGGRGGQAFSSLFDQHLTQRMAGGKSAEKLVNSIVKKIERSHPELFHETDSGVRHKDHGGKTGPDPVSITSRTLISRNGDGNRFSNASVRQHVAPSPRG